jgi:hypothetical protein
MYSTLREVLGHINMQGTTLRGNDAFTDFSHGIRA